MGAMWKQIFAPTLLIAGLWLVVTPLTTYIAYSLDVSYQKTLDDNVTAMQAAGAVSENIWRFLSYAESGRELTTDEAQMLLPEMSRRIEDSIIELRGFATSEEGLRLVSRLEVQWYEFVQPMLSDDFFLQSSSPYSTQMLGDAETIAATASDLKQVHQKQWTLAERHRKRWRMIIYMTRFAFVVVGPAGGIALGWWISRRFHRSISQINIILKDAAMDWERSLANLRLSDREDLSAVKDRIEMVVERMRRVSAELDAARMETLRSERLAAVGELAAGVAHELRNPLTSVKLLLQNAAQQPGETRLSDDAVCVVLDEVQRMENTIQGMLDFSRPPSPQRQLHDLRDTLQRALNLVQGRAKQQKVRIEMTIPDEMPLVDGDPEQLHQVCVNLLINGIEADPGGTLEIRAEVDHARQVCRFQFRDRGAGIPRDVMRHLFEPFFSTKQRGTGLGLAISRRIVAQHEGSLTADNHPTGGAVLTLELPIYSPHGARNALLRDSEPATISANP